MQISVAVIPINIYIKGTTIVFIEYLSMRNSVAAVIKQTTCPGFFNILFR